MVDSTPVSPSTPEHPNPIAPILTSPQSSNDASPLQPAVPLSQAVRSSSVKKLELHNALVVGATGAIGKHVVNTLLARKDIANVRVIVRNNTFQGNPKLNVLVMKDFLSDLSQKDFENYEYVFCCLGSTKKQSGSAEQFIKDDQLTIQKVAECSKLANIRHFLLVSSVGADRNSKNLYLGCKGKIEEFLLKQQFPQTSIFRPSILDASGQRQQFRLGEAVGLALAKCLCLPCLLCCCVQYKAIDVQIVATAMIIDALNNQDTEPVRIYKGSREIENIVTGATL